jgi:3-oxoadipate enol-lactonase
MRAFIPKAVLFLHAFPLNKDMYREQLKELEKHKIPYIALDYPGFGDEPNLPGDISIERLTDFIVSRVNSLGVRKVIPIGDSMGGYIMFDMWRRYRNIVEGFIFVSTRAEAESEEGIRTRLAVIDRLKQEGKGFLIDMMVENQTSPATKENTRKVCELRSMMEKATQEGIIKTMRAIAYRKDSLQTLRSIDVPTVVVAGSDDEKITPPSVVRKIAEGIKGAKFYEIPDSAHLPPFENPEEFNKIMIEFLQHIG